jgi:3'(2'),5'-bisphosphate nucleotidase
MSTDPIEVFLARTALEAGHAIMEIYRTGFSSSQKPDLSPVTEADLAAERLILERLSAVLPGIPVVAEELEAAGKAPPVGRRFLLVDPLDGTREFIAQRNEFTTNIALIVDGRPVAGAIYAPAIERLWYAGKESYALDVVPGAPLQTSKARRIRVRSPPPSGLVVLVSRSHPDPHTESYLGRLQLTERRAVGSSLKFCLIAQGAADIYPRFGQTSEWDTAAGHAILLAAGGDVTDAGGQPLRYGNRAGGFRHHGFVARGGLRLDQAGLPLRT